MMEFKEAYDIVVSEFGKLTYTFEEVELLDSLDRILAEDIASDIPMPSFDNSAMDGISVKYSDGVSKWKIIGEAVAGSGMKYSVQTGEAVYITTGARIPEGCDTIIPVEEIEINANEAVLKNSSAYMKNKHIRRCGEDIVAGTIVLKKNTLIKQQHIAMAASCGSYRLRVYRQLKIGVFASGNELVDITKVPVGDKVRGSNLLAILAGVKSMNMIPVNLGYLEDSRENVDKFIRQALGSDAEVLISTGGVSAGKYDYIADAFRDAGVGIKFRGVNIKPGKPMVFGTFERDGRKKLIFGLPGNPVSSFVNFLLFVRNAFYSAIVPDYQNTIFAKVNADLIKKDNKTHFVRGKTFTEYNEMYVLSTGSQSSANILGLSDSDCLIVFPGEEKILQKGSTAECIMI